MIQDITQTGEASGQKSMAPRSMQAARNQDGLRGHGCQSWLLGAEGRVDGEKARDQVQNSLPRHGRRQKKQGAEVDGHEVAP